MPNLRSESLGNALAAKVQSLAQAGGAKVRASTEPAPLRFRVSPKPGGAKVRSPRGRRLRGWLPCFFPFRLHLEPRSSLVPRPTVCFVSLEILKRTLIVSSTVLAFLGIRAFPHGLIELVTLQVVGASGYPI